MEDKVEKPISKREFLRNAALMAAGGVGASFTLLNCAINNNGQFSRDNVPGEDNKYVSGTILLAWEEVVAYKFTFKNGVSIAPPQVPVVYTDTHIVISADTIVICNKPTAMTVTLPVASGGSRILEIKNIGAGLVTVATNGADTLDGELTQSLYQWEAITIVDYAANSWAIY